MKGRFLILWAIAGLLAALPAALIPYGLCAAGTPRRLSRAEYVYTVRDLLGVNVEALEGFPREDAGGALSPALMERYLRAAEGAARMAVLGAGTVPAAAARYQAPARLTPLAENALRDSDATGLSLGTAMHFRHRFAMDGAYEFTAEAGGAQTPGLEIHLGLWVDGRQAGRFDGRTGEAYRMRARVEAGEHVISVSHLQAGAAGRVHTVEVKGPFEVAEAASAESLRLVNACGHFDGRHTAGCERKIVEAVGRRAFRRRLSAQEAERFAGLIGVARARGGSFAEGVALAIEAMLISPQFLFHTSGEGMAARLSYFLWSSIPDEALVRAEERGELATAAGVAAQAERMGRNAKAARLAKTFGAEWLETRRLETVKPDAERFPEFDEYLRWSMARETELFFDGVRKEDASILDFLNGRYSYWNQRLAVFYGVAGIAGSEFRRVPLAGTARGGVLTQASVLTVSSYSTRTSPVLRGKWVLGNLLGAPPPPPPTNVPNLDEGGAGAKGTARARTEEHRRNAACAGCHAAMDPLGFGLEHFNAIGEWRGEDGGAAIDDSGKLPDGRAFRGAVELEAVLGAKPEEFARCLTEKLMAFALGREGEKAAVAAMAKRVAADGYRFSALVREIVTSAEFRAGAERGAGGGVSGTVREGARRFWAADGRGLLR